ncbi:hypothetical protein ACHAXT_001172 [Thalassiosira profunda]
MAKKRRQDPASEAGAPSYDEAPADPPASDDDAALSSESEDERVAGAPSTAVARAHITSDGKYRNKQRLLLLSSRGVTARYRHLLEDLRTLIPHSKKESKLDHGKNYNGAAGGGYGAAVNAIAEARGCHTVLFLECRKRGQDGYMWLGRTSHANTAFDGDAEGAGGEGGGLGKKRLMIAGGPSVKFHITNVHTMDELKMTGNCMKGSRPVLSFDNSFDEIEHLKLIKHLFVDVFGTPRGHPKSKPFVDRVLGFYYADGKVSWRRAIWVRNYQILEETASTAKEAHTQKKLTGHASSTSLIEIGPRFVLNPIRIFRGSFGGQTLYVNEDFVNPNVIRANEKREKGEKYVRRKGAERKRKQREEELVVPEDPLADVFS